MNRLALYCLCACLGLAACRPAIGPAASQPSITEGLSDAQQAASPTATPASTEKPPPPPTATAVPPTSTPTATPSPTLTPTATSTPSPTAIGLCGERKPYDDLLAVVSQEHGLSREFAPIDLRALSEHLPFSVTLGYPTEIREVALQPLVEMIEAMQAAGLQPRIISGYRSYPAQAIAWNKWNAKYPETAAIVSAQPGHSEHQLGTVVDFGSPELAEIVGEPDIEFHTWFYKTSEGAWLAENAHLFGFTLSFPLEEFETTGFYYEPWHFRYVGRDLAAQLYELGISLTMYQLQNHGSPCTP